jgi:hypothetical protein
MRPETEIAQQTFMQQGGVFARALLKKRQTGEIERTYVYHEYPKMLRTFQGTRTVDRSTEVGNGSRKVEWTETQEIWDEVIVHSEEEEERVLAGGKTEPQIEEERQALIRRCEQNHIRVDPRWKIARLRRELGGKDREPTSPSRVQDLEKELAQLRAMAEMQAEITALRAQLAGDPLDEETSIRNQLALLGVKADGRWSLPRLREELDRATAPRSAA